MRYFKQHWGESRGDAHNAWGCSLWYFETDGAGVLLPGADHLDVVELLWELEEGLRERGW
jgi:hypothetical protein